MYAEEVVNKVCNKTQVCALKMKINLKKKGC